MPTDFNIKNYAPILATAYGEGANQSYEGKRQILSTILNRAESGKKEFGADTGKISDVLQKGYYAYSKQSPKFMEASQQKFPDKQSEDSYKEFVAILSGLLKGNVQRSKAEFFFTPQEVSKLKKSKSFNMKSLDEVTREGDHIFYSYKDTLPGKGKTSKKEK